MSTLQEAIAAHGYTPPEHIKYDGNLHRFATDANKKYSRDGWYVAFDDSKGKAGCFGSWRDGSSISWSNGAGRKLTDDEKRDIEAKRRAGLEQARKDREEAAKRAQRIYQQAAETGSSGYLAKKGIQQPVGTRFVQNLPASTFGIAIDKAITALVVPVYGPTGEIATLQLIEDDGNKLFMKNGATGGGWFAIGEDWTMAKCVVIAEGLATAQSIHEASGLAVLSALNAGNLPKVAQMVRAKNAKAEILLAVDGDKAGRDYSDKAARAVNGRMIEAPEGMDWNDVHAASGLQSVRSAFVTEEINTLWKADLIVKTKADGTETIVKCVSNFVTILSKSDEWRGVLSYDSFLYKITPKKDTPIGIKKGEEFKPHSMTETRMWLETNHFRDALPKMVVDEAVVAVAMKNESHQVKEFLSSLAWDGVPRIEEFLIRATSCNDSAYSRAVSVSLFISAVNRIYQPGSQVDTVVVLEGPQGLRKSTLLKVLFKKKWCAAVTSDFKDKDFYQNLHGKWCMVFDDLHRMKSTDQNTMKQIISAESDTYRASYAAHAQDWPRQNIFSATTNEHQYLDDPSGGRRFLPIVCKKIDIDYVENNVDQLWAEAVNKRLIIGNWWDIPDAGEHQDNRQELDPWYILIGDYCQDQESRKLFSEKCANIFPEAIMSDCLNIPARDFNKAQRNRVVSVLTKLGYKPHVGKDQNRRSYRCYRLET